MDCFATAWQTIADCKSSANLLIHDLLTALRAEKERVRELEEARDEHAHHRADAEARLENALLSEAIFEDMAARRLKVIRDIDELAELRFPLSKIREYIAGQKLPISTATAEPKLIPCGCCDRGRWATACCNGSQGCSCGGQTIDMGACNVCYGTGYRAEDADTEANLRTIRGLCYIGSGPRY